MGFYTTFTVLNDDLDHIANDPDFGSSVRIAALNVLTKPKGLELKSKGRVVGRAVSSYHCDNSQLIYLEASNHDLLAIGNSLQDTDKDKIALLKRIASDLGYSLRKKKTK